MRSRIVSVVLSVATLGVGFVRSANAHADGVITLNAKQLGAGDTLRVAGRQLGKGASYRLELRGALETINLGRVRADTAGTFTFTTVLSQTLRPGNYAIAAVAADGDVSARADLIVNAATAASGEHMPGMMPGAGGKGMQGMQGMAGMHATPDKMPVTRRQSAAEWGAIVLLVAGAALAGAMLLRRPGEEGRSV